ncbi:DUF2207 domain-containing protein [Cellulomonas sp. PhB150]|uniref:DUF2207 domain-containing protein n=1 Tax=Cellulomonas sp. PhB150 TaxID=2485188 RepID=UPI000F4A8844|nr:DUF2207 domain-containing protein [Cellulomonas sp. PhB150]ROS27821.1 putative membrane protein DUF2207 [Cellulomonas sp. PhB150]
MRSVAVAVAGLFVGLVPVLAAGPAAADGDQQITHYAESVQLDSDGTAHVAIDLSLDFADTPGHGPYLTVPVREATDDGRTRVYTVADVSASSPSNAPADVDVQDDGTTVEIRIGDPSIGDIDGVQQYHVEYTLLGLINTDATTGDGDQLYWDPIGPDWELPLSDVTVSVAGPSGAERAECYAGEVGSTDSCSSSGVTSDGAVFAQDALSPGEALTVVAGWPAGTFPGATAMFDDEPDSSSDDAWAEEGLPEGPLELDENGNPPSFVQGPDGSWSEVGADRSASNGGAAFGGLIGIGILGVVITIIVIVVKSASGPSGPPAVVESLAARGYLRMDPVAPSGAGGRANWMLTPLMPMDSRMSARERAWYNAMFFGGMVPVYWSHVRPPVFHSTGTSVFSSGSGAGGGGGFGGDGGAGGGAGGGGGGSW